MDIALFTSSLGFYNHIRTSIPDSKITIITDSSNFDENLQHFDDLTNLRKFNSFKDISNHISNMNLNTRILSFASGYIFASKEIARFPFPILNFHTGSIPENRGKTPLFWDIVEDKKNSYGTLHAVSEKIDMGRILSTVKIIIRNNDTPKTLADKLLQESINNNLFVPWLTSDPENILKIKETTANGNYKKSFKIDTNYIASDLTYDYLLRLWRCYKIWGKILINGIYYDDISSTKNTTFYLPIRTKDDKNLYFRKLI